MADWAPVSTTSAPGPAVTSGEILDALDVVGTHVAVLRQEWPQLSADLRRERLAAVIDAADVVRRLADLPVVDPEDRPGPTIVPDAITAVRSEPTADSPPGGEVFDRVLGIVAAAGGLSEVLAFLIEDVRPNRAPIDEAIAAFRLDRTRGPYAERAVQLLEAALRTGLFH